MDYGLDMQQWLWGEKYESSDEYWHVSQLAFNFCVYKKNEERLIYMYLTPTPNHLKTDVVLEV